MRRPTLSVIVCRHPTSASRYAEAVEGELLVVGVGAGLDAEADRAAEALRKQRGEVDVDVREQGASVSPLSRARLPSASALKAATVVSKASSSSGVGHEAEGVAFLKDTFKGSGGELHLEVREAAEVPGLVERQGVRFASEVVRAEVAGPPVPDPPRFLRHDALLADLGLGRLGGDAPLVARRRGEGATQRPAAMGIGRLVERLRGDRARLARRHGPQPNGAVVVRGR